MPPVASDCPAHQPIAVLYGDHHGWLVGWLRARLGCSQQAADLAQDTFVRLLLADPQKSVGSPLKEPRHFLVTVAKRVMIDGWRLERLVDELQRYRGGYLGCAPQVADLRVSGAFPLDDIDQALEAIAQALPVQIVRHTRYWTRLVAA
ncbi:sigma factor [Pseudomonas sp. MF4836]|uniref:sigma factor n=1 Tax=Pseudomonas sp. MF4836 TaxID=1960827 RepID=UPI0009977484|nr:sigma factor [Pseudomonas sp. MF4836]